MSRLLRFYLLGCIAFAFAYLLLHVWEPLRLNVGDPWLDATLVSSVEHIKQNGFTTDTVAVDPLIWPAYRPTHPPPLAEMTYGAMGKLGITPPGDIGAFRLVALALSALAMWLLFSYARRIWSDTVALIATALFSTSALWMMFADSVHRPPGTYAFCFLALWGLVRAIETRQPRHHAAVIAGSFACWFAASDDRILLLAGVLFTIYVKLGNPFGRGHRRFVLLCAAGCLAGFALRSLLDIDPVEWQPGVIEWQMNTGNKLTSPVATLLRRYSLVFTPMFWITLGYTAWRVLRAPTLSSVLRDGMTWLVAVAAIFFYVSSQYGMAAAASPMLRAEPLLPFYAIGSAILIARLLEGGRIQRALAIVWVAAAPVWAFAIMLSHPRSVLDRADVAKVRSYLAANDQNGFVMSNLMSDGPIQAAFDRLSWPAAEADDETNTHPMQVQMLDLFETTGSDRVHAVIFTDPDSRFVDRSLGQLLMRRRLASVTGWPNMVRSKTNALIRDYDRRVVKFLEAVGATRVLRLSNFDVYRIDRQTVLELVGRPVPVVRRIDFSSHASYKHKLLGWGEPKVTDEEHLGASSIDGHATCVNPVLEHRAGEAASPACGTMLTGYGLAVLDRGFVNRAQLMIRVERACDLRLTFELASSSQLWRSPLKIASSSLLELSLNDFTGSQCERSNRVSFLIPQRSVREGVNVITLEKKRLGPLGPRADVLSLVIEPICVSAP
jgi:hypothetical protein